GSGVRVVSFFRRCSFTDRNSLVNSRVPSHLRTTLALLNAAFGHFLRIDIFSSHTELCLRKLLLENWWRTADTAPLQSNIYLHAVGDLDERDAARPAVFFPIKG